MKTQNYHKYIRNSEAINLSIGALWSVAEVRVSDRDRKTSQFIVNWNKTIRKDRPIGAGLSSVHPSHFLESSDV